MIVHVQRPPLNESPVAAFNERTLLAGAAVSTALYGIHFIIYLQCAYLLWRRRDAILHSHKFLAFVSTTFVLGTLSVIALCIVNQYTFIDYRNLPGGPLAFAAVVNTVPVDLAAAWSSVIGDWFTGSLLLWRTMIVYRGSSWRWIILFPALIFLGSVGLELRYLVHAMRPNLVTGPDGKVLLPFFVLSNSLVVVTSILIAGRLLFLRRRLAAVLGDEHARYYISIVAMVIESAAIVAIFAVIYLVLYAVGNPVQSVFLYGIIQVTLIGPLLIIYRVAQGRAWSSDTAASLSQFNAANFQSHTPVTLSGSDVPVSPEHVHLKECPDAGISGEFINKPGNPPADGSRSDIIFA